MFSLGSPFTVHKSCSPRSDSLARSCKPPTRATSVPDGYHDQDWVTWEPEARIFIWSPNLVAGAQTLGSSSAAFSRPAGSHIGRGAANQVPTWDASITGSNPNRYVTTAPPSYFKLYFLLHFNFLVFSDSFLFCRIQNTIHSSGTWGMTDGHFWNPSVRKAE